MDDLDGPEHEDDESPVIQKLRKQAAKAKELEAELEKLRADATEATQLRRELAFEQAGIPRDKLGKLFRDSLQAPEGQEFTAEWVKEQAVEYGLLDGPKPEGTPEHQQAIRDIASVSGQPAAPQPSVIDQINSAESEDEVWALADKAGIVEIG